MSRIAIVAAALVLFGCGGDKQGAIPCAADNPFPCPVGQTCWPIDTQGAFLCLASKDFKKEGDDCAPLAGHTTCGDAMVCVTTGGGDAGAARLSFCAAYCDPKRPQCGMGKTCVKASIFEADRAPYVNACLPSS